MWVALMEPCQMIFTSSLQPAWKDQRYRCGLVRQIRDLCKLSRMPVSPWPGKVQILQQSDIVQFLSPSGLATKRTFQRELMWMLG